MATTRLQQVLRQSIVRGVETTAILLTVLGLVIALVLRWFAIKPLRRLTAVTKQISAGDLSVHVEDSAHDEFGDLARHFNAMTAQLRQMLDSMRTSEEKYRTMIEGALESIMSI